MSFCEACELHKKNKCHDSLCPNILFIDIEDFFKKFHSSPKTPARCDLILHKGNALAFIELKSADRYTKEDGTVWDALEIKNMSAKEARKHKIPQAFDSSNAINKIKNTAQVYFKRYPEGRKANACYYFFISNKFFDYWHKKNTELDFPRLKLLLLNTTFSTYLFDGPVDQEGRIYPLVIDLCSQASNYLKN